MRRRKQRVGRDGARLRHPPGAGAVQHAPLERHRRQQAVERALPVRGDDDDAVAAVVRVAHLALRAATGRRLSFAPQTPSGAPAAHHALPRQTQVCLRHAAAQRALDRSLQRRVGAARRLHQAAGRETKAARGGAAATRASAATRVSPIRACAARASRAQARPRRVRRPPNKSHLLHCAARTQPRWRTRNAASRARAGEPAARAPSAEACGADAERAAAAGASAPQHSMARPSTAAVRHARPLLLLRRSVGVCRGVPPAHPSRPAQQERESQSVFICVVESGTARSRRCSSALGACKDERLHADQRSTARELLESPSVGTMASGARSSLVVV